MANACLSGSVIVQITDQCPCSGNEQYIIHLHSLLHLPLGPLVMEGVTVPLFVQVVLR